jgi:hypothetical protein
MAPKFTKTIKTAIAITTTSMRNLLKSLILKETTMLPVKTIINDLITINNGPV